jgi:hypothetical protein
MAQIAAQSLPKLDRKVLAQLRALRFQVPPRVTDPVCRLDLASKALTKWRDEAYALARTAPADEVDALEDEGGRRDDFVTATEKAIAQTVATSQDGIEIQFRLAGEWMVCPAIPAEGAALIASLQAGVRNLVTPPSQRRRGVRTKRARGTAAPQNIAA